MTILNPLIPIIQLPLHVGLGDPKLYARSSGPLLPRGSGLPRLALGPLERSCVLPSRGAVNPQLPRDDVGVAEGGCGRQVVRRGEGGDELDPLAPRSNGSGRALKPPRAEHDVRCRAGDDDVRPFVCNNYFTHSSPQLAGSSGGGGGGVVVALHPTHGLPPGKTLYTMPSPKLRSRSHHPFFPDSIMARS